MKDNSQTEKIYAKQTAQILELDQSQIYTYFKENRIKNHVDETPNRNFTTRGDLLDFLNAKIPSDYKVVENTEEQVSQL